MKKGKALEQLVSAIQDHLKNCPDTDIQTNVIFPNISGNNREIDVYVKTRIQGMDFGIAFECKDYKRKVDVSVIDGFITKCSNIKQINKGVIVSTSGFTKAAIQEANNHKIGLFQLNNIPLENIFSPYEIFYTRSKIEIQMPYSIVVEDENNPEHYDNEGNFYYCSTNSEIDPITYMAEILQVCIPNMVVGIQKALSKAKNPSGDLPLTITPPEKMYILDINGNKHIIKELRILIRVHLNTELQNVVRQNVCVDPLKQTSTVKITEYPQKEDASLLLIESKDSLYSAYLKSSDGNVRKTILYPQLIQISTN
ncbi:MAG: restriction endonuclease [Paludibacteraceae bacterium]|nr:restriction endonuclease [Paludibacteraceae bacterium]MBQ5918298.1 restriction endonuclease [Lachnospiraceae bacterium]